MVGGTQILTGGTQKNRVARAGHNYFTAQQKEQEMLAVMLIVSFAGLLSHSVTGTLIGAGLASPFFFLFSSRRL